MWCNGSQHVMPSANVVQFVQELLLDRLSDSPKEIDKLKVLEKDMRRRHGVDLRPRNISGAFAPQQSASHKAPPPVGASAPVTPLSKVFARNIPFCRQDPTRRPTENS